MAGDSDWGGGPSYVPDDIRGRWTTGPGGRRASLGVASPGLGPEYPGGVPGAGLGSRFVLLPPTYLRPSGATDFNVAVNQAGLTAATTPLELTGSAVTIPPGNVAVIRSLVLGINTVVSTTAVTWALLFDGSPVPGWSGLGFFPGALNQALTVYGPDELQLPVPEGTRISVAVTVADAGNYQAGAQFHGWWYSREIQDAADAAWGVI